MKTVSIVILSSAVTASAVFGLLNIGVKLGKIESIIENADKGIVLVEGDYFKTLETHHKLYTNLSLAIDKCDNAHKSRCSLHALPTMPDTDPSNLLEWCKQANGVECSWTVAPNHYDSSVIYPLSNAKYTTQANENATN